MKVKQLIFAAFACTVLVAGCSVDTEIVEKNLLKEEFEDSSQLKELAHNLMSNISSTKHQTPIKTSYFSSYIAKMNNIQNLFVEPSCLIQSKANINILQSKFNYLPDQAIFIKPSFLLARTYKKKSELIFTSDFHDSYVQFGNRRRRLV